MSKYDLKLKGTVGYWDFNKHIVDDLLEKKAGKEVHVLIDSLGGIVADALSISSAFAEHGNVYVHYRGMNASAATISSMGAKHISIEASALYLVHKCSFTVFEWDNLNAENLLQKAEEYKKLAADAEKVDITVATLYAKRCKKPIEELSALMAEDKWLTAQEALEWGFVDEIVDGEEVKLTASVATAMANAGMPVPAMDVEADGFLAQLEGILSKVFRSFKKEEAPVAQAVAEPEQVQPSNNNLMTKTFLMLAALLTAKEFSMPEADENGKYVFDEASVDAIEENLAQAQAAQEAKDAEIAALQEQLAQANAHIEELEAQPAAVNDQVVETSDKPVDDEPSGDGGLAQVIANAREMMK